MAIPRIFLSSTCYNLGEIRDSLRGFIKTFGFEPCLSDYGDVFYHPDLHTHESCIKEISTCHIFVLLIGGRFGGAYNAEPEKSIVNAEYSAAKELNIPVFSFIKRDVYDDHRLFQTNKQKKIIDEIDFPSIEKQKHAQQIFRFIDEIRLAKVNNGTFSFEYSSDIEKILMKQWAGMFYDFLQSRSLKQQYESQNSMLSALTTTSSQLEELVKNIYRTVDTAHADNVIEDIEVKALAVKFITDTFQYTHAHCFNVMAPKELASLIVGRQWYEFLAASGDFHISKNVLSSNDRMVDIITHNETSHCIPFQGELIGIELKRVENMKTEYNALSSLKLDLQIEIIEKFTL